MATQSKKAMKSMGTAVGLLGLIALVLAFGCETKTGVRASQPATAGVAQASGPPALTDGHCVHCHPVQPAIIGAKGAKHKTEVGCQDCHVEHPPAGAGAVPACSMCHSDGAHYELEGCGSCHVDTHAPLEIKLEGDLVGPCLTCHQQQGNEVQAHPSAHTDLACNECHSAHRLIPECMECHEKHTPDMNFQACKTCHPVHMPLVVAYPDEIPSHYCGACHGEAVSLLQANTTKHHDLACAYCHKQKHKNVPPCQACHGSPHPARMLEKFETCGACHGTAHDLK